MTKMRFIEQRTGYVEIGGNGAAKLEPARLIADLIGSRGEGMDEQTPLVHLIYAGVLNCSQDLPLGQAAALMFEAGRSSVVVVDGEQAIGIWTESDALKVDFDNPSVYQSPISEFMTRPVQAISAYASIAEAAHRFRSLHVNHLLVKDEMGNHIGVLTQSDLLLNLGLLPYLRLHQVRQVMRRQPLLLAAEESLSEAAAQMRAATWQAAIVVDQQRGLGLLTERDLLRCVASYGEARSVTEVASRPLLSVEPCALLIKARGLFFDHQVRHLAVADEAGNIEGLLGLDDLLVGTEMLYKQDLEEALKQRDGALDESRFHARLARYVLEGSREAVLITDSEMRIEYVNPAFCRITGYSTREVTGKTPRVISSGDQGKEFYQDMWRTINAHKSWEGDIWNRRKSGEAFLASLSISAIEDEQGNNSGFVGMFTDVSELREHQARASSRESHDPLTSLPNRRLFEERMVQTVASAQANGARLGLMVLNLDGFKQVNDTLGHELGDQMLQILAARMRATLSNQDMLARLASDEFVGLIASGEDVATIVNHARKILASVREPVQLAGQQFRIGCSAGVALFPEDGKDTQKLIRHASAAMKRAKLEQRNTLRLYCSEMDEELRRELALESSLRTAVESGEGLEVYYQPVVDAETGELVAVEALLRWFDPNLGSVSPGRFIPVAEQSGLISELGDWVLAQVCRQLAAWREAGIEPVPVAVNLSAHQLWSSDLLLARIRQLLAEHDLPSGLLSFELTESAIADHRQDTVQILHDLNDIPCEVAIDDFGTGYSSLAYLHDLPVSTLKIDRIFVQRLGRSRRSAAILTVVANIARELGLRVIAEGVETQQQLAELRRYRVQRIQGFLTGRPMTAQALEERLGK